MTNQQKILRLISIRPLQLEEITRTLRGHSESATLSILESMIAKNLLKSKTFSPYPSKTVTQYRTTGKGRASIARSDRDRSLLDIAV